MPTATGAYTIKVSWQGNKDVAGAEATVNLAVTTEGKYVFSVISNSTISELTFDSPSKVLGFTVNGTSGTTGYANITIAKEISSVTSLN